VTPANLLYNVIATPVALYRYWRQGQTPGGRLALVLIAGALPAVAGGPVIRVKVLPGRACSTRWWWPCCCRWVFGWW